MDKDEKFACAEPTSTIFRYSRSSFLRHCLSNSVQGLVRHYHLALFLKEAHVEAVDRILEDRVINNKTDVHLGGCGGGGKRSGEGGES